MRIPCLVLLAAAVFLGISGCQTSSPTSSTPALTVKTVGPAYATYVMEKADGNKDLKVTRAEWVKAGGSARSFASIDLDKNGSVTKIELIEVSSTDRFLAYAKKHTDVDGDNVLTPRDFRSPAGVRLLSFAY